MAKRGLAARLRASIMPNDTGEVNATGMARVHEPSPHKASASVSQCGRRVSGAPSGYRICL